MRATCPSAGIRGFFPFIKTRAPDAFLPISHYGALAHARIAIDATLLTQKFVFSDDEHPARHLTGLVHVVKALRAVQATPILVFDHPTARLPQKMFAMQKRMEQRAVQHFRCAVEAQRLPRVRALQDAVNAYEHMPAWLQQAVSTKLRQQGDVVPWREASEACLLQAFADAAHDTVEAPVLEAAYGVDDGSVPDALASCDPRPALPAEPMELLYDDVVDVAAAAAAPTAWPDEWAPPAWPLADALLPETPETVWQVPPELYAASPRPRPPAPCAPWAAPHLAAQRLAHHLRTLHAACDAQSAADAAHAPLLPSPNQRLLQAAEQSIYTALRAGHTEQGQLCIAPNDMREMPRTRTAAWLAQRSAQVLATHTRSVRVVTLEMYNECITLCTLLNVPIFVVGDGAATGGTELHEAEAFASALVREGYADFVASEDSDVFLYHVPLLRGLGGAIGACALVDAQRVRTALFPERDVPEPHAEAQRRAKLLQYALLCGTDFNQTIPKLGPIGAYKQVLEHGTVARILEETTYTPPLAADAYLAQLAQAAHVFEHPPAVGARAAAARLVRRSERAPPASRNAKHMPPWAAFLHTTPMPTPTPARPRYDAARLATFLAAHGVAAQHIKAALA